MSKPIIQLNSIDFKSLHGSLIQSRLSGETLGSVSDIVIEPYEHRIFALLMQTYSLIPLSRIVLFHNIIGFSKGKVIIKSENSVDSLSSYKFPPNAVLYREEANNKPLYSGYSKFKTSQTPLGIIKNARCDAETGTIEEFVISKQKFNMPWSKNEKITANKFRAVDNTIIIEQTVL